MTSSPPLHPRKGFHQLRKRHRGGYSITVTTTPPYWLIIFFFEKKSRHKLGVGIVDASIGIRPHP